MTFLQLAQRLRTEAGIAGTGPTTVINQSGELGRLVNYINDAYEEIQGLSESWYFMRNDFTFNTVSGTNTYARSTIASPALENWRTDSFRIYTTSIGVNDEQWLLYRDWDTFRDTRVFSSIQSQTGRPIDFSVKPDKTIILWPKPNAIYTVRGEYWRTAHVLVADADTPLFSQYQMLILFAALKKYAAYVNETALFAYAQNEYARHLNSLRLDRAATIQLAGPLL